MHSSGSIASRLHSVDRPSARSASRWFGTSSRVRANQNPDRPVRTRPLSGISVGSTTSKVEIRSLATSNRRSSSSANNSRTLPLATCVAASGMNGFLLPHERAQALEDGVDMSHGGIEVEDRDERVLVELPGDLRVLAHKDPEVALLFPRAHCISLHESIGLVAWQTRVDEREQQTVAEEEEVARLEVPSHPFGIHDESVDDPDEAVEHVVEGQERVRDHDALGGRVRDVALVPERHVLEPHLRGGAHDTRQP